MSYTDLLRDQNILKYEFGSYMFKDEPLSMNFVAASKCQQRRCFLRLHLPYIFLHKTKGPLFLILSSSSLVYAREMWAPARWVNLWPPENLSVQKLLIKKLFGVGWLVGGWWCHLTLVTAIWLQHFYHFIHIILTGSLHTFLSGDAGRPVGLDNKELLWGKAAQSSTQLSFLKLSLFFRSSAFSG